MSVLDKLELTGNHKVSPSPVSPSHLFQKKRSERAGTPISPYVQEKKSHHLLSHPLTSSKRKGASGRGRPSRLIFKQKESHHLLSHHLTSSKRKGARGRGRPSRLMYKKKSLTISRLTLSPSFFYQKEEFTLNEQVCSLHAF